MKINLYFFIVLLSLLTACNFTNTHTPSDSSTNISPAFKTCKNKILVNKRNISSAQLHHCKGIMLGKHFNGQTKWYMKDFRVDRETAQYRLGIQQEVGQLDSLLSKDKTYFAGLYIQNKPDYSINILVKDLADTNQIKKQYIDKSWAHFTHIRPVQYSLQQLKEIRRKTENVFDQHNIRMLYLTDLDIKQNRVKLLVNNKKAFIDQLKAKKVALTDAVLISEGNTIVCTAVGCSNQITINLTQPLKPDTYTFKVRFDQGKAKLYRIKVSNKIDKNCQSRRLLYPSNLNRRERIFSALTVDSLVCKDTSLNYFKAKHVAPFSKFTVSHYPNSIKDTENPVNMGLAIVNSKGITLLNKKRIIQFDKNTKHQPNGKQCEPICYKANIKF